MRNGLFVYTLMQFLQPSLVQNYIRVVKLSFFCVFVMQKRREEEQKKLIELQQKANEMRAKEEARRRQEQEMNMLRETEDEFRQLQLKEQQQLELDRQRRHSNTASSVTTAEEPTALPVMPSAPPGAEPSVGSSPSPPPDVLPPSYTSVVYVGQKPVVPSRDLKPTSNSTTYVFT